MREREEGERDGGGDRERKPGRLREDEKTGNKKKTEREKGKTFDFRVCTP